MTDVRLFWHNQYGGFADVALTASGDFDRTEDLATSVIVSLFSDRLALASDKLPQNQDDRRGWWGDTDLQRQHPGDLIGSRIWLLRRHTSDEKTPLIARDYILESLQWMIEDGVAGAVDANCFFIGHDQRILGAVITITRRSGERPVSLEFQWAWAEIGG